MTAPRRSTAAAAAVVAASVALCLTACGSSSGSAGTASTGGAAKVTNLTYWSWTKNAQQVVDAFNASHKDVHVTLSVIAGGAVGYAKIFAAIKAGNGPDLFNCEYAELPDFVSQGDVQDISQYVTSDTKAKFASAAIDLTTLGGKSWAVPYDVEPELYYYRKDLFTKYHLTVPTTWAQFQSTAQALKKVAPKAVLANFNTDDPTITALSAQAGAHWFSTSGSTWTVNFTDAASQKVASYWQNLIKGGLVSAYASNNPSITADVTAGTQIGMIDPPFEAAYIKTSYADQSGKWAVAPLPTWDGTAATSTLGGSTTTVSKNSKYAAAGAEFATWVATDATAVRTRVTGGTSSALPADPQMADIAQQAFDASYFGGQDVYSVFKQAATTVTSGQVWGPSMVDTITALTDGLSKVSSGSTIAAAVQAAQQSTVAKLQSAGLSVTAG